jgi:hypothetical protein
MVAGRPERVSGTRLASHTHSEGVALTITINAAQADKLAQFAGQWPDLLVVHQLPLAETNEADAMDLYVASAGEETRWRVSVDGRLIELKRGD